MNEQKRYVEGGNFPAQTGETVNYQYPTSVFSLKDGSSIVVSYGTNEIISYNVNGIVNFRSQGPLSGFLRPFDVYVLDNGDILVSEYGGDRVSVLDSGGIYKTSFGEKGMGDGQFMGPQYITVDSKNYVYVTDFGNNRVNVFNPEYQFVFSFGEKNSNFAGFTAVGGICCLDDLIYVGDGGSGALYCFDVNGNYIETAAPKKTFKKPEGIREWKGKLLVSDYNKMVLFDPVSMELTQVGTVGKASTSLMSSSPDVNGNILTAEFRENDVKIFSGMTDIAGGLFVQIESDSGLDQKTVEVAGCLVCHVVFLHIGKAVTVPTFKLDGDERCDFVLYSDADQQPAFKAVVPSRIEFVGFIVLVVDGTRPSTLTNAELGELKALAPRSQPAADIAAGIQEPFDFLAAEGEAGKDRYGEIVVCPVFVKTIVGGTFQSVVLLIIGQFGLQGEPVEEPVLHGDAYRETAAANIIPVVKIPGLGVQGTVGVAAFYSDVPLGGGGKNAGCGQQEQE